MARKLFKAKLKTAGKTPEELLKEYDGPKPSDEFIQNMIKANDSIDGLEVVLMDHWSGEDYSMVAWQEKDNDVFRDFIYQSEQDEFFGSYVDDREEFLKDWDSGDYSPMGSLTFGTYEVEILGELEGK